MNKIFLIGFLKLIKIKIIKIKAFGSSITIEVFTKNQMKRLIIFFDDIFFFGFYYFIIIANFSGS